MYEFSIEQLSNKINDSRTKSYFEEVLNNYFNGNYRSASVMLWSVVVCDLIYKMQYLKDIHSDSKAIAILKMVEDYQASNPNNPSWELQLVTEIFKRTNLIDAQELDALETIQKHRHLSAHPILKSTTGLFKPAREMVLCDIRVALESVLIKPPILTVKVFEELVTDLEKIKDLFPQEIQLKKYLNSKYIRNLNDDVVSHIFRSLWRLTFKTEDEKCNENRNINYRAIRIIFEPKRELLTEYIRVNSSYFSQISENSPVRFLIFFLGDYPNTYHHLEDSAKEIIKVKAFSDIDLLTVSYFFSKTIEAHIKLLCESIEKHYKFAFGSDKAKINKNHISDLLEHAKSAGVEKQLNRLLITMYINSQNFDAADFLFDTFIEENISKFEKDELDLLLEGIENNNQTYWRGKAKSDHQKILKRCIAVYGEDFDQDKYSHLPEID